MVSGGAGISFERFCAGEACIVRARYKCCPFRNLRKLTTVVCTVLSRGTLLAPPHPLERKLVAQALLAVFGERKPKVVAEARGSVRYLQGISPTIDTRRINQPHQCTRYANSVTRAPTGLDTTY